MNIRIVIRQLGLVLIVLSFFMGGAALWGGAHWFSSTELDQMATLALVTAIAIGAISGLVFWLMGRQGGIEVLGRREALLLVALSWLIGAALSALPFYYWAMMQNQKIVGDHPFTSFISCYFEAMSGLTTTGATVLSHIEVIPHSLLLWRATTHWLGGLGIVVLFVAVLPTLGVGGKKLFQVESPGPQKQGVRPRIKETARVLWLIYLLLTLTEIFALGICGVNWFDAVCHTFATLATGGFSTMNASIGHYNSWAVDMVIILFMVLAGLNFGLYYQLARRRFDIVRRDPEMRAYFTIILVATLIITASIVGQRLTNTSGEVTESLGLADAARYSLFQVVSIQTTTGFCTADFNLWHFLPKAVLVILMFVGASAGSTGGGIKVVRVLVAFKVIVSEVERVFRPRVVRTVKLGRSVIDPELRLSVLVYVLGILLLFGLGAVAIMFIEPAGTITFTTAATASAATLNNIGPGLGRVGAVENYGFFSPLSKLVMSMLMVLGRLEVYAILVLVFPRFWRSD